MAAAFRRSPGESAVPIQSRDKMQAPRSTISTLQARRVAVVRLRRPDEHPWAVDAAFDAIEAWLAAAGHSVVYRVCQRRRAPAPATYLGSGKALQLRALCELGGVEAVVVDGTPTPTQRVNLQRLLDRPTLDRTGWAPHDATAPALIRTRTLHRSARRSRGARSAVLIGCVGAGKSTLFAALIRGPLPSPSWPPSDRRGRPAVVTRLVRGASGQHAVLVTDTPGVIWHPERGRWAIPAETAAEWREADVVLHVIDASHPEAERRARQVGRLLRSGAADVLPVWTQADRVFPAGPDNPAGWTVSGRTGVGCDGLIAHLEATVGGW
jgi:50S ribosomal subunit-associated GTPase HflX